MAANQFAILSNPTGEEILLFIGHGVPPISEVLGETIEQHEVVVSIRALLRASMTRGAAAELRDLLTDHLSRERSAP